MSCPSFKEETKISEITKEELIQFVVDLKNKQPKITWEEIAERVQAEFTETSGLPLTGNAIRKRYHVWLRKLEDSERSNNENQGAEIMSKKAKEQLPKELSAYIENYIE